MRPDHAWPSSRNLELEAGRLHTAAAELSTGDEVSTLALSRLPVFFDLSAFAVAAATVFPQTIFHALSPQGALMVGSGLCALPLLVGPVGSWLSRGLARRHGNGVSLTATHCLLGLGAMAIAFTPTASPDWMIIAFLATVRIVQGVAFGGIWRPLAHERQADFATLVAAGLGLFLVAGLFAALAAALPSADFTAWGWRYPFLMGFVVNIVALFASLRRLTDGRPRREGGIVRLVEPR